MSSGAFRVFAGSRESRVEGRQLWVPGGRPVLVRKPTARINQEKEQANKHRASCRNAGNNPLLSPTRAASSSTNNRQNDAPAESDGAPSCPADCRLPSVIPHVRSNPPPSARHHHNVPQKCHRGRGQKSPLLACVRRSVYFPRNGGDASTLVWTSALWPSGSNYLCDRTLLLLLLVGGAKSFAPLRVGHRQSCCG